MSKLDELLQGVDVEWKRLDTIYKFQYGKGNTIPKKGGLYPVYGSNGIVGTHSEYNSEDSPVIGHIGAYAGIVNWGSGKHFVTYNGIICKLIDESVNPKFAYYFLLNQNFNSIAKSASHPFISYEALNKVLCPIPCPDNPEKSLEIQQEIVRVLDELTSLTNQLTTELETERQNRKKQFEFFREQMFRFEEGENNYVALGELAENLDSKRKPITSSQRKPGKIPYYGASGIVDYVEDYIFDGDYLLVSEDGANLLARSTPIAFSISGKNWVNNHAHILKFETKYERLFVEYYLNSIDLAPYITGAAQPKLNKKNLNSIKIPNPALEEKERIVKLLDQLDATHTAIEEEITKEIKLRTQQYEYYREKLLSFPSLRTT
ncbi:restriction endonuclease subunit S [Empedobacter falsenii]|uniref:restriction endonuclease subunit S n=1 Tax=Empedobacter falsenii TaxID=343874 RepID=UPI003A804075